MLEVLGTLDVEFDGKIIKSSGEFENQSETDNVKLISNVIYILQDISVIKDKLQNSGNFVKIRIRNDKTHYEVAVGGSYFRIMKFKPE